MALIPADVGLRMRLDNELLPQQIKPVQEIPADLPRLQAGQVFTAQIREVLPENTYLALVAGKNLTLSLPEGAKSGDVLELVVVDQTPKTIIARLANPPGTEAGEATTPQTSLSQTAQMLRSLLITEGETPAAAALNRGQPLLAQPPKSGAELVPVLSKAVNESGLFYEAHQAQWVAGKLSLASLRQEPQGQQPAPAATLPQAATTGAIPTPGLATPAAVSAPIQPEMLMAFQAQAQGQNATIAAAPPQVSAAALVEGEAPATAQTQAQTTPTTATQTAANASPPPSPALSKAVAQGILLYQANQAQGATLHSQHATQAATAPHAEAKVTAQANEIATQAAGPPATSPTITGQEETREAARVLTSPQAQTQALSIPDDLRALVQQQLDAAGTQRLLWHGEIWPDQTMEWQLEWKEPGSGNSNEEAAEPWATTLRLTTPRLGQMEASLQLGEAGVRITLTATDEISAADMRAGAANLENSLAAAGVPLRGFTVKHEQEDQA